MNRAATNGKAARRFPAWDLKQPGWSPRQIAEAMGGSDAAVSPWMPRGRQGGPEALRSGPPPGAPRRRTAEPVAQLPDFLRRGAAASGCRGQGWTCGRLAAVIRLVFGVSSHPGPVSRIRQQRPWSPPTPLRRARQRDEAAIPRWYAPELNPGEGLWQQLKGVELRHVCGFNLSHLRVELRDAVERVRRKPRLIQSLFRGPKL